jgi:hypothetical protein
VSGSIDSGAAKTPEPTAEKASDPVSLPRQQCDERVDQLVRNYRAYDAAPTAPIGLHGVEVPTSSKGVRATAELPVLEVGPGGWLFRRSWPADAAKVAKDVPAWLDEAVRYMGRPTPIYLAADAEQSVQFVATLLTKVPKADVKLLVMGQGPVGAPPPGAKALADHLTRASNANEAATIFSLDLKHRFESCPPLAKRFRQITTIVDEQRPEFLANAIDQGLRECQCGTVDLDALEYAASRILNWENRDYHAIDIPHDQQGNLLFPKDPTLTIDDWIRQL